MSSVPIVLDNGSGVVKCGFAGNDAPSVCVANEVGSLKPTYSRVMAGGELTAQYYVGDALKEHSGALVRRFPMSHGDVDNWDDMLKENLAAAVFEKIGAPAFYAAATPALCCYATGKTTACVVEVGDGVASATPIYEGFAVPHAIVRMDVAGRDVTTHLTHLLRKAGHSFYTSADFETARVIKETLCRVATDPTSEDGGAAGKQEYCLPDGHKITLSAEAHRAAEILFQPKLIGSEFPGMHEALHAAIMKCDPEIRAPLWSNVLLAGGTTAFKGFGQRLLTESRKLAAAETKIKILAPSKRKILAWVGGSILASLGTFRDMVITKEAWEEQGARLLLSMPV